MTEKAYIRATLAFTVAGCAAMALGQAVRAWDGAFFAYEVIHRDVWVTPWDRWTDVLWELPARATLALTGDLAPTLWAFAVGFAVVPLLAVVLCRIVAGDRSDLFAWGVLGICAACLPGQWFVVAEGLIALQLGWPLLLAVAAGIDIRRGAVAVLLAPAVFWQHPFASAVFAGAAGLLLLAPYLPGARVSRGRFVWAGAFVALGALRVALVNPNEGQFETEGYTEFLIRSSTDGLVRPVLVLILLAAVAVVLQPSDGGFRFVPAGLLAIGGILLVEHVATASAWADALNYRAAVLPVSLLIFALFLADLRRSERPAPGARAPVAAAAAAVFALVLVVQGVSWRGELDRLADSVAEGPTCRSIADVTQQGPLVHWGTAHNAVLEQGEDVDRLVLGAPELCRQHAASGQVALRDFDRRYVEPPGRFRLP